MTLIELPTHSRICRCVTANPLPQMALDDDGTIHYQHDWPHLSFRLCELLTPHSRFVHSDSKSRLAAANINYRLQWPKKG